MNSVCAFIICYLPAPDKLLTLIDAILMQHADVVLFDNGGIGSLQITIAQPNIHVLGVDRNVGIGVALNMGFNYAKGAGYDYFISFDQDSQPSQSLVYGLIDELQNSQQSQPRAVAIGPQIVDRRTGVECRMPFIRFRRLCPIKWNGDGTIEVGQLITSGCLFDLRFWGVVPRFNEMLFIDLVDHNWCWRTTASGHVLLGTTRVYLYHELSEGIETHHVISTTRYNAFRRYFQSRNIVYHLFHEKLDIAHRVYLFRSLMSVIASALLADPARRQSARSLMSGAVDGCRAKLGPRRTQARKRGAN